LQHPPNRPRTLPFSNRCRFGARPSPNGAGGGGHEPSELEASEGGPGACPELEAPGHGGVDGADMAGEGGSDISKKCRTSRESRDSLFSLRSRRFFAPLNAALVP
jgi:hypothetical protein